MRFVDYLMNQVISFFQDPSSLHEFDRPKTGAFNYNHLTFTEKNIKNMIANFVQPFFNKIIITGENINVSFNSFPYQEAIPINI